MHGVAPLQSLACPQEVKKRRRLMKRASKLTPDDLLQLCVIKGVAAERACDSAEPDPAEEAATPNPGGPASGSNSAGEAQHT